MFNRRKRITKYYMIEKQGNAIFVSHTPRWLFYFANKEKFFSERERAYQKIADLLTNDRFWRSATNVTSRSFTIDFTRDRLAVEDVKLKWHDKPGIIMLWLFNFYNWRISRMPRLKQFVLAKRVSRFLIDRNTFILAFERR